MSTADTLKSFANDAYQLFEEYNPFPMPSKAAPPSCALCEGEVHFWCVECEQSLCSDCMKRMHWPGTINDDHSIEEVIAEENQGVRILKPFVNNGCVIAGLLYILNHVAIKQNYLYTAHICPSVNIIAKWMSWLDSKIFYMSKAGLNESCGVEDYFFKLFLDGWVRDIVTQTDDVTLLFMTTAGALSFKAVFNYFITPIFAVFFAVVQTIAHRIELKLPRSRVLVAAERNIARFDVVRMLCGTSMAPPVSKWRTRPTKDVQDLWSYWKARQLKRISNFYDFAAEQIDYYISFCVWGMACFRLVCIVTPHVLRFEPGLVIRAVLSVFGFRKVLALHESWFKHASTDVLSDELVMSAGWSALGGYKHIPSGVKGILAKVALFAVLGYGAWMLLSRFVNDQIAKRCATFEAELSQLDETMGGPDAKSNAADEERAARSKK